MPLAKPLVFHQRSESPRSSGKVFKLRSEQEFTSNSESNRLQACSPDCSKLSFADTISAASVQRKPSERGLFAMQSYSFRGLPRTQK